MRDCPVCLRKEFRVGGFKQISTDPRKVCATDLRSLQVRCREQALGDATLNETPDELAINTIRLLAVDAIQQAKSGHPGTPMDAAPTAYVLWQRFLRYDPVAPDWMNRDRFVLSSGHASVLLYTLIHLSGIKAPDGTDAGTVPSFGVMRRWPLLGADHWRGRISVRNRNPGYHYRRRTELGAADRRHVATNASAAICSFAGSPGNWRFLP
jgi:hypothetical protein